MVFQEFQRYNWAQLRRAPLDDATRVPFDLERLALATDSKAAEHAYWCIDNVVVVQGALYESAVATVPCVLSVLQQCTDIARPFLLELLMILSHGEASLDEIAVGNTTIAQDCLREVCRGIALYFDLLEHGTREEQLWCVDILSKCCDYDSSLKPRVVWWFHWLLQHDLEPDQRSIIMNSLGDL